FRLMLNVRAHIFFAFLAMVSGSFCADPLLQPPAPPTSVGAQIVPPSLDALTSLPVQPAQPVPAFRAPTRSPYSFPNYSPAARVRPALPTTTTPAVSGPDPFAWDSTSKEYSAKAGELTAQFS